MAEGLQKSASTAKTFGVTLEESAGHITAIGAVTMESGRQIGNGLKTIYSRITTLQGSKDILEGVGVAIYEIGENGEQQLKPVNAILADLGEKWGTLSSEQQQNVAVTVAGRYQLSRFLALMNNWDMATNATTTALTSQGSAMRENARYMESFEARINQMKNAWTELALKIGDNVMNSSLSVLIDTATKFASAFGTVVQAVGFLPAISGIVVGVVASFGLFNKPITMLITNLRGLTGAFGTAAAAGGGWSTRAGLIAASTHVANTATRIWTASLRLLGIAFVGLAKSLGVIAVFMGVAMAIEKIVQHMNKQRDISEKVEKANNQLVDSYRNTEGGLDNLIRKQKELQDKVNSGEIEKGTAAYNEYVQVTNQLAELMPTVVEYVDQSGLAHLRETKAIEEQYEYAKRLSELKAEMAQDSFQYNISELLTDFDKEVEKIDEYEQRLKDLQKIADKPVGLQDQIIKSKNGKPTGMGLLGGITKGTAKDEATNAIRESQRITMEMIQSEQRKQDIIQKTLKMIQDTTLAYLESEGVLKNLSDASQRVVEKFVQANEEFLRSAEGDEALMNERTNQMYELAGQIGNMLSDTRLEMTKGITDPLQLQEITQNFDVLVNSIPENFFSLESFNNIGEMESKMETLLSVASKVENNEGSFNSLRKELESLNFTEEEASSIVSSLAKQYNNAELRTEALRQSTEMLGGETADLTEVSLEATSAIERLFGVSKDDAGKLKSHITVLQTMGAVYGDNAKKQDAYLDSLEALSMFTGLPPATIEKDIGYYSNLFDMIGKVEMKYDEATGAMVGFNREGLNSAQVKVLDKVVYLASEVGIRYDTMRQKMFDANTGAELIVDTQGNIVEAIRNANGEIEKNPKNGQQAAIFQSGDEAKKTLKVIEDMTAEVENYIDKTIEAIDASEVLFGFTDGDVSAMKSHLESLMGLSALYGENAKNVDAYKSSLSTLSDYLGIPEDVIEKDFSYYYNSMTLMEDLKIKMNEAGKFEGWDLENLNATQREIFAKMTHYAQDHGLQLDHVRKRWYRISDGQEVAFDSAGNIYKVYRDINGELTKSPEVIKQENVDKLKGKVKELGVEIQKNNNIDMIKTDDQSVEKVKEKIDKVAESSRLTRDEFKKTQQEKMFNVSDMSADVVLNNQEKVKMTSAEIRDEFKKTRMEKMFNDADLSVNSVLTNNNLVTEASRQTREEFQKTKQEKMFNENDLSIPKVKESHEQVKEASRQTREEFKKTQLEKMFNENDGSTTTAKTNLDEVKKSSEQVRADFKKTQQEKIFNENDTSPAKAKEKIDGVKTSIDEVIKKMQEAKQKKIFEDAGMEAGAGGSGNKLGAVNSLTEAIKKATESGEILIRLNEAVRGTTNHVDILISRVGSVGELSGKLNSVLSSLQNLNTNIVSIVTSLIQSDTRMRSIFIGLPQMVSSANAPLATASTNVSNLSGATENARIKTMGFTEALRILASVGIGGLPIYVNALRDVSTSMMNATNNSKVTAEAQNLVVTAFERSISASVRYSEAVRTAGNDMGNSYGTTAAILGQMTTYMIEQHNKHEMAVVKTTAGIKNRLDASALNWSQFGAIVGTITDYLKKRYDENSLNITKMVDEVKRQLDRMTGVFGITSNNVMVVMTSLTSRMKKEYMSGILEIVKATEGLPKRIGDAIRRNIGDASSAMDTLAKDMVRRFKKELGIHSPSRVFENLGGWVIQGLVNGLSGGNLVELGKDVFGEFGGEAYRNIDMIKSHMTFDPSILAGGFGQSFRRSSGFGMRNNPKGKGKEHHGGIDYAAPTGTPIRAKVGGTVVGSGYHGARGNFVRIRDLNGMEYIYQHNHQNMVKSGQTVRTGQVIGTVGSTGRSTGAHLHFEVLMNGRQVNPESFGFKGFATGGLIKNEQIIRVGEQDKQEMIIPLEQHRGRAVDLWKQAGERLGMFEYFAKGGTVGKATHTVKKGDTLSHIAMWNNTTVKAIMDLNKNIKDANKIYVGQTITLKSLTKAIQNPTKAPTALPLTDEQQISKLQNTIALTEQDMRKISEHSGAYRNKMQQIVKYEQEIARYNMKILDTTKKRQTVILQSLSKIPAKKRTEEQQEQYTKLRDEYDQNISKIQELELEVKRAAIDIAEKVSDIFNNLVAETEASFDRVMGAITDKITAIDFKMEVFELTEPDNLKLQVELELEKLKELKNLKYHANKEHARLQELLLQAVAQYGANSAMAVALREQVKQAQSAMNDIMLQVLRSEQELRSIRAGVADSAIDEIKNYYGQMKDLELDAIDRQIDNAESAHESRMKMMDAEIDRAEKAHDGKMKMIENEIDRVEKAHDAKMKAYDEEIDRINKIYDAKMRQIDDKASEDDYQEQLGDLNAEKASLQQRIALLSRSDDLDSRKKREELQKELADKQKEINDLMRARQRENLKQELEDQRDKLVEEVEREKEAQETIHSITIERLRAEQEAVEAAHQANIERMQEQKERQEEAHRRAIQRLNEEKEEVTKHYDSIINDEQRWATLRNEMIKGNFQVLEGELALMQNSIVGKNASIFQSLQNDFNAYMNSVRQQVAALSAITVPTSRGYEEAINQKNSDGSDVVKTRGRLTTGTFKEKWQANAMYKDLVESYGANKARVEASGSLWRVVSEFDTIERATKVLNRLKERGKLSVGYVSAFDTGGFTGKWNSSEGKLAVLHEKELVLKKNDTGNFLKAIDIVRDIMPIIQPFSTGKNFAMSGASVSNTNSVNVHINIESMSGKKDDIKLLAKEVSKQINESMRKRGK